ncbi:MAG: sugar O-acetyltransferase [Gemmatimonadetes bacterium]|nr:sugar O-acetyltransferase [Gemmatimonadota bacterium]
MTEREMMLRGELYVASDPDLTAARTRARRLCQRYNLTDPEAAEERADLLQQLLGRVGIGASIEPPFYCDYGSQIDLGDQVFVNFNCVFLDPAAIRIGSRTMLAPNVQLLSADHPRDPHERVSGRELARPIVIGERVWLGGGSIVCPGVTIGNDTTIGAGSVVVRDIPSGVVAVGNPCRVVRSL